MRHGYALDQRRYPDLQPLRDARRRVAEPSSARRRAGSFPTKLSSLTTHRPTRRKRSLKRPPRNRRRRCRCASGRPRRRPQPQPRDRRGAGDVDRFLRRRSVGGAGLASSIAPRRRGDGGGDCRRRRAFGLAGGRSSSVWPLSAPQLVSRDGRFRGRWPAGRQATPRLRQRPGCARVFQTVGGFDASMAWGGSDSGFLLAPRGPPARHCTMRRSPSSGTAFL